MSDFVYVLVNPLRRGRPPFYVGVSIYPKGRFYDHCRDQNSPAYHLLCAFLKDGLQRDQILKIYRKCSSRREALDLEYKLVISTPNLVNRPYVRGRGYT